MVGKTATLPAKVQSNNTKTQKGVKMKKAEFVELVQKQGGYEIKKEAERALNAVINAITEALTKKEDVALIGFGTFTTAFQKGKTGQIPGKLGQTYTTIDKYVPKFKAGKKLKEMVESVS